MYLNFKNDLIERYLQAVRFFLPKRQRQDVSRELREDLESRIEDREDELNRALSEEELGGLLRDTGHPILLALGYQDDRYLISPRTFPLYWLAVKVIVGILAIVHLLIPAVFVLVDQQSVGQVVQLFLRFPAVVLPALAWTTVVFIVLDTRVVRREMERALADWSPRSLPPLIPEADPKTSSLSGVLPNLLPRNELRPPSIGALLLTALLHAWWLVGLYHPYLLLGPAVDAVAFGPIFYELYIPMVIAGVGAVTLGILRWSCAHHRRLLWLLGLTEDVLRLAILFLLFRGGREWMVAGPSMTAYAGQEPVVDIVNLGLSIGLTIGLVTGVLGFAWKYLRPSAWPWMGDGDAAPSPNEE
jgi:hypothetical protein